MATYKFRAKAINGSSVTGTLDADGRDAAFSQLLARRLVVLNIEEAKAAGAGGTSPWLLPFRRQKVRSDSLIFFTYQLAAMLGAGLPIVRSLTVLEDEMAEPFFRHVLKTIRSDIEGGEGFSASLAKFPKVFNRVYVNLVSAGEQSGNLDDVLKRLAQYMDNLLRLMRKIRSALAYPAVLVLVTIAVVTLLMVKVIPVFEDVYSGANVELPSLTQWVINISRFMRLNLLAIFGSLLVFVILNNGGYRILKQRTKALQGHAAQTGIYVAMDLVEPSVDYVGLARSLGVAAERAKTVHEATDLVAQGLKGNTSLLIDVALDRAFKPM